VLDSAPATSGPGHSFIPRARHPPWVWQPTQWRPSADGAAQCFVLGPGRASRTSWVRRGDVLPARRYDPSSRDLWDHDRRTPTTLRPVGSGHQGV